MGYKEKHSSRDYEDEAYLFEMDKKMALKILMKDYGEEIKRLIYTYTKNWSSADDLSQEVFVSVYSHLDQFERKSSVRSWIYSIAINRSKDYLKSWHYRNMQLLEKLPLGKGSSTETPEHHLLMEDESREMMQKIFSLPIKYREVIILFYYKELSIKEMSDLLQLSESVIKTRLHRGREKLRLTFSEQEGSESHV
ncbi:MAG: sigma-70 family RNA polymerase sigma factor [Neobacillus sp.]